MTDLDARCFQRKGNTLIPCDAAASDFLSEIADGKEVLVTIRRARNPSHHRFFFAMLRKVVENSDQWRTEDELLDALKLATGHAERRMTISGEPYLAPRSISFAAMGEDKFRRFKNRCVHVLAQALGWDPITLMEEVDATQAPIAPAQQQERVNA